MAFPIWLLGVLLAVGASVVSNLGLNLQKRAHMNMIAREKELHGERHHHHHKSNRTRTSSSAGLTLNSNAPTVSFGGESSGLKGETKGTASNPISPNGILKKSNGKQQTEYHRIDPDGEEEERQVRRDEERAAMARNGTGNEEDGTLPEPASGRHERQLSAPSINSPSNGSEDSSSSSAAAGSPHFYAPTPKSFTSLNELSHGSIDLDTYGTKKGGAGRNRSLSAASAAGAGAASSRKGDHSSRHHSSSGRRRSSVHIEVQEKKNKASGSAGANGASAGAGAPTQGHYTKQPIWILGLICVILGSLLDFTALAFVDQAVVAPLGSLTLVSNVFFAPLLLKETVNRKQLYCTALIIAGSILAVAFAPHSTNSPDIQLMFDNFARARFIVYAIVCVGSLAGLRFACWKFGVIRRNDPFGAYTRVARYHTFCYAACAGIMGAQSVLFAKCTAMLLAASIAGDGLMFVFWGTYFVLLGLGITIFLQIRWLNSGLRMFSALLIVPIFQSFWILISVIAGMIFFGEYAGVFDHLANSILFPVGLGFTILGVYCLTQIKQPGTEESATLAAGEVNPAAPTGLGAGRRRRSRSTVPRAGSLTGPSGNGAYADHRTGAIASGERVPLRGREGEESDAQHAGLLSSAHPTTGAANGGGHPNTPLMAARQMAGSGGAGNEHYGVPQSPRDTPPAGARFKRPAPLTAAAVAGQQEKLDHAVDVGSYSNSVGEDRYLSHEIDGSGDLEAGVGVGGGGGAPANLDESIDAGSGSGSSGSGSDSGSDSEDGDRRLPSPTYPNYAVHSLAPINFPMFLLPRTLMEEPPTPTRAYFMENSSGFNDRDHDDAKSSTSGHGGGGAIGLGGLPYAHLFRIAPVAEDHEGDEENPPAHRADGDRPASPSRTRRTPRHQYESPSPRLTEHQKEQLMPVAQPVGSGVTVPAAGEKAHRKTNSGVSRKGLNSNGDDVQAVLSPSAGGHMEEVEWTLPEPVLEKESFSSGSQSSKQQYLSQVSSAASSTFSPALGPTPAFSPGAYASPATSAAVSHTGSSLGDLSGLSAADFAPIVSSADQQLPTEKSSATPVGTPSRNNRKKKKQPLKHTGSDPALQESLL